jgi:hypothetical protein
MPSYRIYFRTRDVATTDGPNDVFRMRKGRIGGRDDFEACDDRNALLIAQLLSDACADVCETFELWEGDRKIDTTRAVPHATAEQVNARNQEIVIEQEMVMRDSNWHIATSRRLLERLQQAIAARPGSPTDPASPTKT